MKEINVMFDDYMGTEGAHKEKSIDTVEQLCTGNRMMESRGSEKRMYVVEELGKPMSSRKVPEVKISRSKVIQ